LTVSDIGLLRARKVWPANPDPINVDVSRCNTLQGGSSKCNFGVGS